MTCRNSYTGFGISNAHNFAYLRLFWGLFVLGFCFFVWFCFLLTLMLKDPVIVRSISRLFQNILFLNITWRTRHHFLLWLAVDKAFNVKLGYYQKESHSSTFIPHRCCCKSIIYLICLLKKIWISYKGSFIDTLAFNSTFH